MNCSGVKVQSSGNILSEDFDEFVAQWPLSGIFTIQMSGATANGCRDTVFQAIEVFEKPEALFTVSPTTLNDLVVDFSFIDLSTSNDPLNYLFFVNNMETYGFFPTLFTVNMLDQPFDSLMFKLITTTDQGCQDTANIQIPINTTGGIYIPNAFSPNDDNINDWFKPLGFNYLDLNFEIFDRWGNSIYSETVDKIEKLIGWNGKINNNAVKHDVYVYRIRAKEFNGKTYKTTGRVTLIR
jgi:gliding motility-associated-like protein